MSKKNTLNDIINYFNEDDEEEEDEEEEDEESYHNTKKIKERKMGSSLKQKSNFNVNILKKEKDSIKRK